MAPATCNVQHIRGVLASHQSDGSIFAPERCLSQLCMTDHMVDGVAFESRIVLSCSCGTWRHGCCRSGTKRRCWQVRLLPAPRL